MSIHSTITHDVWLPIVPFIINERCPSVRTRQVPIPETHCVQVHPWRARPTLDLRDEINTVIFREREEDLRSKGDFHFWISLSNHSSLQLVHIVPIPNSRQQEVGVEGASVYVRRTLIPI